MPRRNVATTFLFLRRKVTWKIDLCELATGIIRVHGRASRLGELVSWLPRPNRSLTGERVRRTWLAEQRPFTLDAVFRSAQGLGYIPRRPRPRRRVFLGFREAAVKPLVRVV